MRSMQYMPGQTFFTKNRFSSARAQAMVEFALVAPILFLLLFGVIEVGRMVFVYSAVTNASREAVRYGSAVGYDNTGTGTLKYKNCAAIETVAKNATLSSNATVEIYYDTGPGTSATQCTTPVYPGYRSPGDRIRVTVTLAYRPYTRLVPWGQRDFTSTSYRTILGYVALTSTPNATATSAPWTPSHTPTDTPGPSPTPTDTPTPTPTFSGDFSTFTSTVETTPTDTPTELPTDTPTFTPTATATPTSTSTVVAGCDQFTAGPILINSNYMAMTITNPHDTVTVTSVRVIWNTVSGSPSPNALALQSASLGGLLWTGSDNSGDLSIPVVGNSITIPGNNMSSTVFFTFDQNYENPDGNESIMITLGEPCEGIVISSPAPTP